MQCCILTEFRCRDQAFDLHSMYGLTDPDHPQSHVHLFRWSHKLVVTYAYSKWSEFFPMWQTNTSSSFEMLSLFSQQDNPETFTEEIVNSFLLAYSMTPNNAVKDKLSATQALKEYNLCAIADALWPWCCMDNDQESSMKCLWWDM